MLPTKLSLQPLIYDSYLPNDYLFNNFFSVMGFVVLFGRQFHVIQAVLELLICQRLPHQC